MAMDEKRRPQERSRRNTFSKQGQRRRQGPKQGQRQGQKKNNQGKTTPKTPEAILNNYFDLVKEHLNARRNYFTSFYRAGPQRQFKTRRHFYTTAERLRSFESSLDEKQRSWLEKSTNGMKLDLTYGRNHRLPPSQGILQDGLDDGPDRKSAMAEDPHFLPSQKEAAAREGKEKDTEESVGTMEDYRSLKSSSRG